MIKSALIIIAGCSLVGVISCGSPKLTQTTAQESIHKPIKATVLPRTKEQDRLDPRAFDQFVNGTLYDEIGDYEDAARSYRNALQFYPESYEIRFSLAMTMFHLQRFEDVIEALDYIDPEDAQVYELRGAAYRYLGEEDSAKDCYLQVIGADSMNSSAYSYLASLYGKDNNLDSLIWCYENIVRIKPSLYRMQSELGKLYARKGDLKKAEQSFTQSIETEPGAANTVAYAGLGEMLETAGNTDSAMAVYKWGLSVDSNDVLLNRMVTNLYIQLDSANQALPFAQRVVEISPQDKGAQRRLGSIYYAADSVARADSIFSALLAIGDRHPANYYYLGRIAINDKKYARAVRFFIPLTQMVDTSAQSWLDLGYAYRQLEQHKKEIETYRTGLNHMRDEESAIQLYFALGAAYEQDNQIDKATETFEELIARSPKNSQALNYLGYMLADRGQRLSYAEDLIKRALDISPDNAAYLDSYGWVLYHQGNYKQAQKYLLRAVELDSDPTIFDHLGDTYKAIGDLQSARTWWQKALNLTPDDKKILEKLKD